MPEPGPLDGHACKGRGEPITRNLNKKRKRSESQATAAEGKAEAGRARLQLARVERQIEKLRAAGGGSAGELSQLVFDRGSALLQLGRSKQGMAAMAEYLQMEPADELRASTAMAAYWIDAGELG